MPAQDSELINIINKASEKHPPKREDLVDALKTSNINAQDQKGQTALMIAVQKQLYPTARFLIHNHARLDVVDKRGNTALKYFNQIEKPKSIVRGTPYDFLNYKFAGAKHPAAAAKQKSMLLTSHGATHSTATGANQPQSTQQTPPVIPIIPSAKS